MRLTRARSHIESAVLAAVSQTIAESKGGIPASPEIHLSSDEAANFIKIHVEKVTIKVGQLEIVIRGTDNEGNRVVRIPWAPRPSGPRRQIIGPTSQIKALPSASRAKLLEGIAKARFWLGELIAGRALDTKQIAEERAAATG